MARTLLHLTRRPWQLTRAALAFQAARTARQQGHSVTMFLAGTAIQLVRIQAPDRPGDPGADVPCAAYEAVLANRTKVCLSDPPARSRYLNPAQIRSRRARLTMPHLLVKLAAERGQVFSY